MRNYDFSICGVPIRIDTDWRLDLNGDICKFTSPKETTGLCIRLRGVDELHLPEGVEEKGHVLRPVYQRGEVVTRCCRVTASQQPYCCLDYRLEFSGQAECTIRETDCIWALKTQELWTTIWLNHLLLYFRTLTFHASYIGHEGRGILFTAASGTGKSTQAELWSAHRGAQVINGDKAAIRLDGEPMAHSLPFCGTSGICENISLPLKAVVVLSQAPQNTVRRLGPSEAVAALCPNVFVDQAIPEEWQMALNLLLDLVAAVPVYALACTPDVRAVEALEAAMTHETQTGGAQ